MNLSRRVFFSALLFARSTQAFPLRVVVLETFDIGGACTAALVHHAEPAMRDRFAQWLRAHPRNAIRVLSKTGEEVSATIFRVRMCFGRGLILLEKPIPIRERDVLTVVG